MQAYLRQTTAKPMPVKAGVGLRAPHYAALLESQAEIGWLEVHSENYFGEGGIPHFYLGKLAEHYPLSFHGVGLSLGSAETLNQTHMEKLKALLLRYQPRLVSEHLSWGALNGVYVNDLLPLPLTSEALSLMIEHVDQLQDFLRCRILIENPSNYLGYTHSTMSETEFLYELCRASGCGLLLDVNNVYVSAHNLGFDMAAYLDTFPMVFVEEFHLAGHARNQVGEAEILIDDHASQICETVWTWYQYCLQRTGAKPTLIEWDSQLPPLSTLLGEATRAQTYLDQYHAQIA